MSGYSQTEIIGELTTNLNIWVNPQIYDSSVKKILENGLLHNQECKFRTKQGEIKIVLLSIELIELNGVTCTLNIINDITERKRLED